MAILSVGVVPTKDQIDNNIGSLLSNLDGTLARLEKAKAWLDTNTDVDLIAKYGYVQAELDRLRSGLGDVAQLIGIYRGTTNLAVAKDFRTFIKLLWGFNL